VPVTPLELKALRKQYGYTQADAAQIVHVTRRTWMSWELSEDVENHRVMPEGLLELFCLKHKINYQVIDNKVHIVYI
jgi:transcriptional regulator with XRE-family HTH domain